MELVIVNGQHKIAELKKNRLLFTCLQSDLCYLQEAVMLLSGMEEASYPDPEEDYPGKDMYRLHKNSRILEFECRASEGELKMLSMFLQGLAKELGMRQSRPDVPSQVTVGYSGLYEAVRRQKGWFKRELDTKVYLSPSDVLKIARGEWTCCFPEGKNIRLTYDVKLFELEVKIR